MASILDHQPTPKNYKHEAHIQQTKRMAKGADKWRNVTITVQGERATMPSSDPNHPDDYAIKYGGPDGKYNCECLDFINHNAQYLNAKAENPKLVIAPFKCYHIFACEVAHLMLFGKPTGAQ